MKLWAGELDFDNPIQQEMFRDRAAIFHDRMKWDVTVDDRGFEVDQYDIPNLTAYLILHEDGVHQASLRLTPVLSACMAIEQFDGLCDLGMIEEPERCAEVTRFCVGVDDKAGTIARELAFANAKFIYDGMDYDSCLGVFYRPMKRIYKRLGFEPVLLNEIDGLCVGQWTKQRYEEIMNDGLH